MEAREELGAAMRVLSSAAEKMKAMEAVKGALQALATANREEATDGKSACELMHETGRAVHIIQRFSDVLEERPEYLAKLLLRVGAIFDAVKPAVEPADHTCGEDVYWIAYKALAGLVGVKREIEQDEIELYPYGELCPLERAARDLVVLLEEQPVLWTVTVSGIADLVTSLPESIQQWQKRKKIKLEDREKREEAQTTAVRILLEVRSVERAENMARDAAAITSRNKLRLLFDGVMCARALEAKGQGANRKEEEMYTGVRKQNERTLKYGLVSNHLKP
jgi:hypothetical protein